MQKNELLNFSYYVDIFPRPEFDANSTEKLLLKLPFTIKTKEGFIAIKHDKGGERIYLELLKTKIIIRCYLENVTLTERVYCLCRFLEVLNCLREAYEISVNTICEPLMEALSASLVIKTDSKIETRNLCSMRIDALSASNSILAIELRRLIDAKDRVESDFNIYREFCYEVVDKFSKDKHNYESNAAALKALGVREKSITSVLGVMNKMEKESK